MFCAVIGRRYIWLFTARDQADGNEIANTILFFEKIGCDTTVGGFDPESGYWKAWPKPVNDEIRDIIEKTGGAKIIEIKKKRAPMIDVVYITRRQKERE